MLATLLVVCAGLAQASATLLLEEPYGTLGFVTATGHAAVYLSGVCAQTPVVLRPCARGELGSVISRYDGVAGYDWLAIPLIPYLYAVQDPADIPLYADQKMVALLRNQYRRNYLQAFAPDQENGRAPGGNWYELVGSAYDRAAYAFEIETTPEQDKAFIRKYNASPNRSHFHLTYRNCADFAKDVMNFYYPNSLHRSIVADVGITTPKQIAKTLIKFSEHHSELQFSRFVIPQVPGTAARSTRVHGVVESFLKSKKYIVPTVLVNPVLAGCVLAVYEGTGAGRFDPARKALAYNPQRDLERPIGAEDRRAYELELNHLIAQASVETSSEAAQKLGRVLRGAAPGFDAEGHPVLRIQKGDEVVSVGVSDSNFLSNAEAERFTQELLEARLREELRKGAASKISESDVAHDWDLLQKTLSGPETEASAQSRRMQTGSQTSENRP